MKNAYSNTYKSGKIPNNQYIKYSPAHQYNEPSTYIILIEEEKAFDKIQCFCNSSCIIKEIYFTT